MGRRAEEDRESGAGAEELADADELVLDDVAENGGLVGIRRESRDLREMTGGREA